MIIYVGNLNYRVTESDLKSIFERFGTVDYVKLVKDRDTGRSKGYGKVEMPDDDAAKIAIESLNDNELKGRQIVVKKTLSSVFF